MKNIEVLTVVVDGLRMRKSVDVDGRRRSWMVVEYVRGKESRTERSDF